MTSLDVLDVDWSIPADPCLPRPQLAILEAIHRLTAGVEGAWASVAAVREVARGLGSTKLWRSLPTMSAKGLLHMACVDGAVTINNGRRYGARAIFYDRHLLALTREGIVTLEAERVNLGLM